MSQMCPNLNISLENIEKLVTLIKEPKWWLTSSRVHVLGQFVTIQKLLIAWTLMISHPVIKAKQFQWKQPGSNQAENKENKNLCSEAKKQRKFEPKQFQ